MVLSGAHYAKSWGCDGGDVLGLILRPLAKLEFLESYIRFGVRGAEGQGHPLENMICTHINLQLELRLSFKFKQEPAFPTVNVQMQIRTI